MREKDDPPYFVREKRLEEDSDQDLGWPSSPDGMFGKQQHSHCTEVNSSMNGVAGGLQDSTGGGGESLLELKSGSNHHRMFTDCSDCMRVCWMIRRSKLREQQENNVHGTAGYSQPVWLLQVHASTLIIKTQRLQRPTEVDIATMRKASLAMSFEDDMILLSLARGICPVSSPCLFSNIDDPNY